VEDAPPQDNFSDTGTSSFVVFGGGNTGSSSVVFGLRRHRNQQVRRRLWLQQFRLRRWQHRHQQLRRRRWQRRLQQLRQWRPRHQQLRRLPGRSFVFGGIFGTSSFVIGGCNTASGSFGTGETGSNSVVGDIGSSSSIFGGGNIGISSFIFGGGNTGNSRFVFGGGDTAPSCTDYGHVLGHGE